MLYNLLHLSLEIYTLIFLANEHIICVLGYDGAALALAIEHQPRTSLIGLGWSLPRCPLATAINTHISLHTKPPPFC